MDAVLAFRRHRARVAAFARHRPPDDPDLVCARAALAAATPDYRAALAADRIARLLAGAPFSEEQRARVARTLVGGDAG